MQTQNKQPTINAKQVAKLIDRQNNGFSSLAQAFIDVISDQNLSDGAAVHLYRSIVEIKQARPGSAWLLPC